MTWWLLMIVYFHNGNLTPEPWTYVTRAGCVSAREARLKAETKPDFMSECVKIEAREVRK